MGDLLNFAQENWFALQQILLSPSRLEHLYLIGLLILLLIISVEQLIAPKRKLRNRSDRIAWGRR